MLPFLLRNAWFDYATAEEAVHLWGVWGASVQRAVDQTLVQSRVPPQVCHHDRQVSCLSQMRSPPSLLLSLALPVTFQL